MSMRFARRLRELRGTMSQEDFAVRIGVKQTSYSSWERGIKEPSISVLYGISSTLGVSADWLLGLSDDRGDSQSAAPMKMVTKKRQTLLEPHDEILIKFAALEKRVKELESSAIRYLNQPSAACCG